MQQRSENTRNRILHSATHLFSQNGYEATSVAEICEAAGVSKGAFYHHFPTKQEVFNTLLQDWLSGIDAQMESFQGTIQTIPETLIQMTALLRDVFQAADERLPMFLEFWTQASRTPSVWRSTIAPYHKYQTFFASLITRGIQEGSIRPVDPDIASRLIVSLALGLVLQGVLDPKGEDWVKVAEQIMRLLMEGFSSRREL